MKSFATIVNYNLPQRKGKRPKTKGPMPHIQLDQLIDPMMEQKLGETIFAHHNLIEVGTGAESVFVVITVSPASVIVVVIGSYSPKWNTLIL